ncbi:T9SS type A sorting domain-containing protein [Pontibacter sp. 172403-2]|uniref:T9SS type A sorting domain-containing protein n=1 Tax=Pontibacter rufus TaxID=2791028 RepID=UPI0018AFF38A|nr:T9SS type A sorting domain-containing protein [Pontibacter sp. 172403-2]
MKAALGSIVACLVLLIQTAGFAQNISDDAILQAGFTVPINHSFELVNPEVNTIEELNRQLSSYYVPAKSFYGAYDSLELATASSLNENIFKLEYNIDSSLYNSYSLTKYHDAGTKSKTAILIIPGSGNNQATEIFQGIGYHGDIVNQVSDFGDIYISVKPNEDFLAIHRKGYKLNFSFITNYYINVGGSYSASYLINAIATAKYLKQNYDRVFILGLSQGASAALLVSLQSAPAATVVASGFTITRDDFEWANQDQIVIPDLVTTYSNEYLHETIKKQHTNYFFSWARNEYGIYQIEAFNGYTKTFFQDVENTEFVSHTQGHSFPQPMVNNFLSSIPSAKISLISNVVGVCDNQLYLKAAAADPDSIVQYQWYKDNLPLEGNNSDSLYLLTGGEYQLVVKNNRGKIFATNTIRLNKKNFRKQITLKERIITAPAGYDAYEWYADNKLIPGADSSLVVTAPGNYHVVLTDEFGCKTSNVISIAKDYPLFADFITSIIYPNPNEGNFRVELVSPYSEEVKLVLYDAVGRSMYEKSFMKDINQDFLDLSIHTLKPGMYYLKVQSARNEQVSPVLIR